MIDTGNSYTVDWIKLRIRQLDYIKAKAQADILILTEEIEQYDYEINLLKGMLEGDVL